MSYNRPIPEPSPVSEPFWTAARKEELVIQRCGSCDEYVFPPRCVCPHCLSEDLSWKHVAGGGTVYTYSIIHRPPSSEWKNEVPYILGVVHLEEDVYLFSEIEHCSSDEIAIGMPVSVTFDHITDEIALPKFEPIR